MAGRAAGSREQGAGDRAVGVRTRRAGAWRLLAALLLLVPLLAACSDPPTSQAPSPSPTPTEARTSPSPGPRAGGTFYYFIREPESIDPGFAGDAEDFAVVNQLFDSLTAYDASGNLVGGAAESWDVNDDLTVFTFHLQPEATFHNGEPVTAASFKRAWMRLLDQNVDPPSTAFYHLSSVRGYESALAGGDLAGVVAVDEWTLEVNLVHPFADFPVVVSHPSLAPIPQAALDDPEAFRTAPVGNGPFAMAEPWQPVLYIRLERFDAYPRRGAYLDQIVFRIYDGPTSVADGYLDFQEGRLDFAPVPPDRMDEARAENGASSDGYEGPGVLDGALLALYYYGFNVEQPPFDDPQVRRALSHLIDRRAIAEQVMEGTRLPATSIVPPGIVGYAPAECDHCIYDTAHALGLLVDREVGPLVLWYYRGPGHDEIATSARESIDAALGPGSLELQALDRGDYLRALREGTPGFFLSGWLAEYPLPDNFLYPLFHTATIGVENLARYSNPAFDELVEEARREPDPRRRAELYREAEALALGEVPILPLLYYRHGRVVADRVHGFRLTPMGDVDMTLVWLADEE